MATRKALQGDKAYNTSSSTTAARRRTSKPKQSSLTDDVAISKKIFSAGVEDSQPQLATESLQKTTATKTPAKSKKTSAPVESASKNDQQIGNCLSEQIEASVSSKQSPSQEAIAFRAWEIWTSQGCPEGKELENWLQAEQELLA